MPRKQSAGLLLFRRSPESLEVMLVHPGGPLWARKDEGAWSIPKGEVEPDEDALAAARREVEEETGARPSGTFIGLSPVRQTGGKIVHVWAIESDFDPSTWQNEYRERLHKLIAAKARGEKLEPVRRKKKAPSASLAASLRASIAAVKEKKVA